MFTPIPYDFACSVCPHRITGIIEDEEEFDSPVFCPRCGRLNSIPDTSRPQSAAAVVEPEAVVVTRPLETTSTAKVPPTRIAWRFRLSAVNSNRTPFPLRNCPAIDDQGRVVAAMGTDVLALVPAERSCEVAWKFSASDVIPGSPAIGANGVTYAHSSDGLLHAIDTEGRAIRPPTKVGPALGWTTPLVDQDNHVWISAATGGLIRVTPDGQTAARFFLRSPSRLDCTGLLHRGVLYIGSEDQFLHAIDLSGERGRELWDQTRRIGLTGWYINSAIALCGDKLLITVSRDEHVYAFRLDGAVFWNTPLPGRAIGAPVVTSDGTIYIGLAVGRSPEPSTGRLLALSATSGQALWQFDSPSPIESTPVVSSSGELYFGDQGGMIHALDARGQCQWSEPVGSTVRSAGTIAPCGQVVFGLEDGSLVALRCDSQSLAAGWPKWLGSTANRCPVN